MELSKTENRSAFAQAIDRRDGAMRDMLGMGSDPVGHAQRKRKAASRHLENSRQQGPLQRRLGRYSRPALSVRRAVP